MSLDTDELEYLDKQIKQYEKEKMNEIKEDIISIFRRCVEKDVYQSYQPTVWNRLYRLLDNINAEEIKNGGGLFVFEDLSNAGYYSAVDNHNVDDRLDQFIFEGHNDSSSIQNQFHHFNARLVLQDAKKMIQAKYPELEVTIVTSKGEI